MGLNSHFVSRFLTRPWEFGQRLLWYYDFDTDRFARHSSRTLFAAVGLNSPEVERRLDELIETPISNARENLLRPGGGEAAVDLEWPLFRALALLLLLQPFRVAEPAAGLSTLEEIVSRPDADVDAIATSISERYRLSRFTVAPELPLIYPSAGYFPLVGQRREGGCATALAIPLSPSHVVVGEPRGVEWESGPDVWRMNGCAFIANHSVGHQSRRVVIHPNAMERVPHAELRSQILEMRASITALLGFCAESQRLLHEMDLVLPG